ncbi:hypothetical protein SV7mr_12430 [Stieleria bergensis]|uniref:Uncharacterized protein n=1 Tax=Stieleria bergensis TaxID=2528025 RepID=A0A517SRJ1_9BACT|nr:hypothetical protein SV7mr_12430 [Planctomycetes bacterium SV_7m_r]
MFFDSLTLQPTVPQQIIAANANDNTLESSHPHNLTMDSLTSDHDRSGPRLISFAMTVLARCASMLFTLPNRAVQNCDSIDQPQYLPAERIIGRTA